MKIQPINTEHLDRCPHCTVTLLCTTPDTQILFPGLQGDLLAIIKENHTDTVFFDGHRIPDDHLEVCSARRTVYDQVLMVGSCPNCSGFYYAVNITAISREATASHVELESPAFEDEFSEDELMPYGGIKIFCVGNPLPGPTGKDPWPSEWIVERLEGVRHPFDLTGDLVRIDRHWIGPCPMTEPQMSDIGIVPPDDLSECEPYWNEAMAILTRFVPEAVDECAKFNRLRPLPSDSNNIVDRDPRTR